MSKQMEADSLNLSKMAELLEINSKMVPLLLTQPSPRYLVEQMLRMTKFCRIYAAPAMWKTLYTKRGRISAVCV